MAERSETCAGGMASICRTEAIIWPTLALLADTSYGDFINPKLTVAFFYIYFSAHKRLGVVKRRTTKQNEISAITTQYKMINAVAYLELLLSGTDPEFVAPRIHCCPSHPLLPFSATVAPLSHYYPPPQGEKKITLPTPKRRRKHCCYHVKKGQNV